MKIQVLDPAIDDLRYGREFHDLQEMGAGNHFLKHLISDIEPLAVYGGIHRNYSVTVTPFQTISLRHLNALSGCNSCLSRA